MIEKAIVRMIKGDIFYQSREKCVICQKMFDVYYDGHTWTGSTTDFTCEDCEPEIHAKQPLFQYEVHTA